MEAMLVIGITAVCFLAAILNLAADTRMRARTLAVSTILSACIGLFFYGYGFTWKLGCSPLAVLRALLDVCRMFGGVNDLGEIKEAPLLQSSAALLVFWCGHFLAFYVTASAAIAALGGRLLQRLRVKLLRRGTLLLIYGVNSASVEYGCSKVSKNCSVVFLSEACDSEVEKTIQSSGAVLSKSSSARTPDAKFLQRIGIRAGHRKLEVAAMHEDSLQNLAFAKNILSSLNNLSVLPKQTSLILRGIREEAAESLVSVSGSPGFGTLFCFDDFSLAARLMIRQLPPCDTILFDSQGAAVEDFHAVIVGFGRMGREVLKQLIMNGQFTGSSFRVDIFDENAQNGALMGSELMKNYSVFFHSSSGCSEEFYVFLRQHTASPRYIVLCTGNYDVNRELAADLEDYFRPVSRKPAIIQIAGNRLLCSFDDRHDLEYCSIYGSSALDLQSMDRRAMILNHTYCSDPSHSPEEDWQSCDYFSRMSSRASADYAPAFLCASGQTEQAVKDGQWPPLDPIILENLSRSEHLRWCAFHYAAGYRRMTQEELDQRCKQYREDISRNGTSSLRISKDLASRAHACLIPWEELDDLSAKVNAATGGNIDYKAMDRNNVIAMKDLLLDARSKDKR